MIFQSTHPSGVRLWVEFPDHPGIGFQSTHPSGVRRRRASGTGWPRHFNPRTPVGCDYVSGVINGIQGISIHAPQWGATRSRTRRMLRLPFQSTHPSGVRLTATLFGVSGKKFQSTHPSGVRLGRVQPAGAAAGISIHAPQWGATFQRRARIIGRIFQSTHPSGVRPLSAADDYYTQLISIHAPQWGATPLPAGEHQVQ